jgi:hypothetical protein
MKDVVPEEPESPKSSRVSPAVVTAIVSGVVTIITVTVQFVVAPLMIRRASESNSQPVMGMSIIAQKTSEQSSTPAISFLGHSPASSQSREELGITRLSRMLPTDPLRIVQIDSGVVAFAAVHRLNAADVADLNCWQLRVLRNIPPAAHGHQFVNATLGQFFRAQSWYRPVTETPMSDTETANIAFLQSVERRSSCVEGK